MNAYLNLVGRDGNLTLVGITERPFLILHYILGDTCLTKSFRFLLSVRNKVYLRKMEDMVTIQCAPFQNLAPQIPADTNSQDEIVFFLLGLVAGDIAVP